MRQLGTIQPDDQAARFGAYLLTLGISAHIEQEEQGWSIWIREEDDVPKAKEELARFEADPNAKRYEGVEKAAAEVQKQERERHQEAKKNVVDFRSQWRKPGYEKVPLVVALIIISAAVTLLTNMGARGNKYMPYVTFAPPDSTEAMVDPFVFIWRGEFWRLISPIFMHMGPIHILFNMMWLFVLGGQVERIRGAGRLAAMVIFSAVFSNCAQAAAPADMGGSYYFGGMSGVNYALFGYVWVKSWLAPSSGFMISDFQTWFMLGWLIFCLTPLAGNVANIAHFAGLIFGVVIAYAPFVMQPQKS